MAKNNENCHLELDDLNGKTIYVMDRDTIHCKLKFSGLTYICETHNKKTGVICPFAKNYEPSPTSFFTGILEYRRRPEWSQWLKERIQEGVLKKNGSIFEEVALTRSRTTGDRFWLKQPEENICFKDTIKDLDLYND